MSSKMNCKVSAHFVPEEDENEGDYSAEEDPNKKSGRVQTLYIIKFDPEVIKREVNFNWKVKKKINKKIL